MPGHDEAKTDLFDEDEMIWYPAVETVDDLYALAEPGARCLVKAEGVPYMYQAGTWHRLGPPPKRH
jgi:hypothetical protein